MLEFSGRLHLIHSWITFRRTATYRGTITGSLCLPEQRVCLIWSQQDLACWLSADHWSDICQSTFSGRIVGVIMKWFYGSTDRLYWLLSIELVHLQWARCFGAMACLTGGGEFCHATSLTSVKMDTHQFKRDANSLHLHFLGGIHTDILPLSSIWQQR